MDQGIRNKLRSVVTQCRKLLEEAVRQVLQGQFGIYESGKKDEVHVEDESRMKNLSEEDKGYRRDIQAHLGHIEALGYKAKDALAQLVREIAFTHLNRLCAYKMMEARAVCIGGKPFRESVSRGMKSQGFQFYLADHPEDKQKFDTGHQDVAYRHFLGWVGAQLSEEIGVLFSPTDPANRLFPPQRVLDDVLALLNSDDLKDIWAEDETIGWVYQYFTPKELRDQVRKESAAPRNSYELAFRNQFFTPRYVVEFLTDNTLGRIWYEMRKGNTKLKEHCRYMVRRPSEVFLAKGQTPPEPTQKQDELTQEELLKQPVHIPHRPKKDPRELRILDPACGSGHFLLYCFALLLTIYEEAYADPDLGPKLKEDYPTLDALRRDVPRLILAHNLHGIDIDLRCTQIAALALWLRCQRAYRVMGLKEDRPKITKSNIVCAEPMPGEKEMLDDFLKTLKQDRLEDLIGRVMQVPEGSRVRATESMVESLNELVRLVWDRMQLAGEAGSLLKIEEELQEAVRKGQEEWEEKLPLFRFTEFNLTEKPKESYVRFVPGEGVSFWQRAEALVLEALRDYARHAANGGRLQRLLFAEDAEHGFAFIDTCQKRYDVVLMNPPFGDASLPSQPYIQEVYADTKGDVYKSFVECFQDRLIPAGLLGTISSRGGFFLGQSADWRERIVLRLFRPSVLADFGPGVLEAMVETAAYVLRSIDEDEDRQLTLRLLDDVTSVETDKAGRFSIPKYQRQRLGLKRHQATSELRRLLQAGYLREIPGAFRRFQAQKEAISRAPRPTQETMPSLFCIRLSSDNEKGERLLSSIASANACRLISNAFLINLAEIGRLPGSPFAYWISSHVRNLFDQEPPFASDGRETHHGLSTTDDFRFVRTWWEVPAFARLDASTVTGTLSEYQELCRTQTKSGKRWVPFVKGGTFSPFHANLYAVIDWENDGERLKDYMDEKIGGRGMWSRWLNSVSHYFRPGITWPLRGIRLSTQAIPYGTIFSVGGKVAVCENKAELPLILAITNSLVFDYLVGVFAGKVGGVQYEVGLMARIPFPSPSDPSVFKKLAVESFHNKALVSTSTEVSHFYEAPGVVTAHAPALVASCDRWKQLVEQSQLEMNRCIEEINERAFQLYKLDKADELAARQHFREVTTTDSDEDSGDPEQEEASNGLGATDHWHLVSDLMSYSVGSVCGRWDVRFAMTHQGGSTEKFDPFAPLPLCTPGMLQESDGSPAVSTPNNYPVRILWEGIIPDDADHSDDIVRRVREVLELIWKDRAEAIEKEACEILGVKELRDYFRKPGKGGFWDDHVARYSKSRRKAPIYWLLQSSKKNYGLWLYYHRLDKDILFKARQNYVEPKIRLEQSRLDSLRSQKTALGAAAKGAKKIDKDIERQEALLGELKDFAEKLERAAKLNFGKEEKLASDVVYDPDLNDGVVLTVAPLWELVPWKEAKGYWEELLEGKYEWSSIGKLLRKKGLVT